MCLHNGLAKIAKLTTNGLEVPKGSVIVAALVDVGNIRVSPTYHKVVKTINTVCTVTVVVSPVNVGKSEWDKGLQKNND